MQSRHQGASKEEVEECLGHLCRPHAKVRPPTLDGAVLATVGGMILAKVVDELGRWPSGTNVHLLQQVQACLKEPSARTEREREIEWATPSHEQARILTLQSPALISWLKSKDLPEPFSLANAPFIVNSINATLRQRSLRLPRIASMDHKQNFGINPLDTIRDHFSLGSSAYQHHPRELYTLRQIARYGLENGGEARRSW